MLNLRVQNTALLLKHLVKFYNATDLSWVKLISETYYTSIMSKGSFWWRDIIVLSDVYRGITKCSIQSGSTALFRNDLWNDDFQCTSFPHLYNVVMYKNDSVRDMCSRPMEDSFLLPSSSEAYGEFLQLEELLESLQLQPGRGDVWSFIWNSDVYTSKRFYKLNFSALQPPRSLVWLWKTKCVMKIKVFAWLLFCDRLNTRDMLDRRHCAKEDEDLTCVLCNTDQRETRLHLFFTCPFSANCWQYLEIQWSQNLEFFQMVVLGRFRFAHWGLLEIFFLAAWHIWKQRNGLIFENIQPTFQSWESLFMREVLLHLCRMKDPIKQSISDWLQTL